MRQNIRASLGAVVLALATLAAVIFALINFDQRSRFEVVYDGVAWLDTDHGIQASRVLPSSPATRAGIRPGDALLSINSARVTRAAEVARRLDRAGLWTQLHYKLSRGGEEFETPLLTAPAEKPLATENYLRIVGLLYLFIGLFIFIRRWNAPRAVHFYVFCLVSFVLWSFHFSGKLDTFDWEVYWSEIVARLLAPALLLHFALVFPGRSEATIRTSSKVFAVYAIPLALLLVHVSTALNAFGFVPWLAPYILLTKLEFGYLALCFLAAGLVFYRSYREAPSGVMRQQLKWLTGGTLAGSLPVSLLYIVPLAAGVALRPWMQLSVLSLVLIPLCFGYAIIRYRLMAVDSISQTLLVDRLAIFAENAVQPGQMRIARSMGVRLSGSLDLSFLEPARPEFARGALFFESPRAARDVSDSVRHTLEQLDLNYFVPCRIREHTVAVLGLGKTVDGDFLSSDDVELVETIAGYVAVALDNAQLYSSLEQKALEIVRLKDFSENIVESLNIGVLSVDLEGIVESWNTRMEQLFGVSRQESVGRQLNSLLPEELAREIAARGDQEQITGIYKQRLQHQGKSLTLNVSITPLVSKSNERIGRLLLFDDVTQRERMEEQMSQTEKLTSLGLLAAGVAHEVNTPLAVISNYIQMLAKQMPEGDPRQSIIEKIVKQTFRASEIVNNLLNFSRTGAPETADIDVNRVVEETLSLVAHPLKASHIQVMKQLGEPLPAVRGSANKLQQVFLNLFLNARDAMPGGGMLEVRTAAHNGSVEIEVADTGGGIAREHIHRIFDPFFTTKASGRGTGLGLSVSYGIIKEHAGKIDVRSTPGKGTSFHVEFPAVKKAVHV